MLHPGLRHIADGNSYRCSLTCGRPVSFRIYEGGEVKRDNKMLTLDVCNLLLKEKKGDTRLAMRSVTYSIPTVGPLVAVAGNVKRPAIYELKGKENKLSDIKTSLAGGLTAGLTRAYPACPS